MSYLHEYSMTKHDLSQRTETEIKQEKEQGEKIEKED